MRHFSKMLGLFTLSLSLSTTQVEAVTSTSKNCPNKFIGTVKRVAETQAPFSSFALQKIKVRFKINKTIRGANGPVRDLKILKHGPSRFSEGEQYEVEMSKNYLCSVKRVTQV